MLDRAGGFLRWLMAVACGSVLSGSRWSVTVLRFNAKGPDGLIDGKATGKPATGAIRSAC